MPAPTAGRDDATAAGRSGGADENQGATARAWQLAHRANPAPASTASSKRMA